MTYTSKAYNGIKTEENKSKAKLFSGKKGNKNQKYIAQVEHQIKSGGDPLQKKKEAERAAEKKKKEAAQKLEEEQKALFRPVMTQKVASGKTFFVNDSYYV